MSDASAFLRDLTLVLSTAAVTTVVFQRLKQPVVLGYLVAGAIISPNTPIPLTASMDTVHTLSELGVILLMFSLGLEFSVRSLLQVGPRAAFVAIVQTSFMMYIGFTVGRAFGWTALESVFAGAAIAISSTTIIVKAFRERAADGALTKLVFAILIVEDLIAILLLAVLTPIATGASVSAASLVETISRLVLFLAAILVVGYLTVPRGIRLVQKLNRKETTLVACVGLCFGLAYLAHAVGYSVALGAFIAGSLVAESGEGKEIEHLVEPVRDMFAAIFFVAVGMLLDPRLIAAHWLEVLVLVAVVIGGKIVGVSVGAFFGGYGTRTAAQAGMSLAQIGEFSFIIASVGLSLGVVRPFLYPIAVAVSAITTLTTPWLIRAAPEAARRIDHALPHSLQTFASLYASWIERLGAPSAGSTFARTTRRLIVWLIVDLAAIALIVLGFTIVSEYATGIAPGLELSLARTLAVCSALLVSTPFVIGILRCAKGLATVFTRQVFGDAPGSPAIASASRKSLVLTIYLVVVLLVAVPLVALTQPVLSALQGGLLLVVAVAAGLYLVFKSAVALDGEVRAGAQVIVDALERAIPAPATKSLGSSAMLKLETAQFAVGKSLADLDLRARTGATVLALERDGAPAIVPTPGDPLRTGDVLALAGTTESIQAAMALLEGGPRS